jgi:hypothetical protein
MTDRARLALAAAQALRRSRGYAALDPRERQDLDAHLGRIEQALTYGGNGGNGSALRDPYAVPLETPADLQRGFGPPPSSSPAQPPASAMPSPSAPPMPAPPPGTEVIGARARQALEAVDFPAFVAGLVSGTFQAIVDSTAQQVREYATLVASITKSVGDFSRDNVSPNQVRDWLVARHPKDLVLVVPKPGERGEPKLRPRSSNAGSPAWLAQYGLADQELSDELVEGPLIEAARLNLGEERLQTLATMVLMGINRIVVNDGQIKARLQFHASARESLKADVTNQATGQQVGIAGRQTQMQAAVSTMVSTINVNAQADVAVRANLVGEVAIKFRTETFDINRFADTQAIQLLTRHSRMTGDGAAPAAESPRPASPTPSPASGGQP